MRTVAYLDFNGSGVETIAHLRENGRIVLMFCAFQGPPNILRLYGRGRVVEPHQDQFAALAAHFPAHENARSIVVVELTRVTDSCGYGVPFFRYDGEREQLGAWARKQGPEGLKAYRQRKNRESIDGLPGIAEKRIDEKVKTLELRTWRNSDATRVVVVDPQLAFDNSRRRSKLSARKAAEFPGADGHFQ